jgi:hypothetical protein
MHLQVKHWWGHLLAGSLLLLLSACDESESTLGGTPGGFAEAATDSLVSTELLAFHRPQDLVAATRQVVGRSDSLSLESVLLFRLDYDSTDVWTDPSSAGTLSAHICFKMDTNSALGWFPQVDPDWTDNGTGESARYLDLDLFLMRDSLGYEDLSWDALFTDGALAPAVLDSARFRVSDADMVFDDDGSPAGGRFTYRQIPAAWFQAADTTARWLVMRARPGQQGFVPMLAAGFTSELRPRVRFVNTRSATDADTSFVTATWQTSVVHDASAGRTLSTGWAAQQLLRLPPFPPDSTDEDYDPLAATLTEAWLRVPLGGASYNATGAKANLYFYDPADYRPEGVDVESVRLTATDILEEGATELRFNITPFLRRVWVNDDTLHRADSLVFALKLDDYNSLQLRQVGLGDSVKMQWSVSRAPDSWGQE